jgi:hypothetical protein
MSWQKQARPKWQANNGAPGMEYAASVSRFAANES